MANCDECGNVYIVIGMGSKKEELLNMETPNVSPTGAILFILISLAYIILYFIV